MTPRQRQRLVIISSITFALALAIGFVVYAFRSNLDHYYNPKDITEGKALAGKVIRIGGMVSPNSIKRDNNSLKIEFNVTDYHSTIHVTYEGILPDLFRENQGVIAKGTLSDSKNFIATEILAKHDETYMPPEVADGLKKAGHPVQNTPALETKDPIK